MDLGWKGGEDSLKRETQNESDEVLWRQRDYMCRSTAPSSPLSSLDVVLPHRNVLKQESHHSSTIITDYLHQSEGGLNRTHSRVDLAVVCGHAVSMVEVGEGLGGAPGLQVSGHSDRRPHLPAVQRRTRAHAQQRAVPLRLGNPAGAEEDTGDFEAR